MQKKIAKEWRKVRVSHYWRVEDAGPGSPSEAVVKRIMWQMPNATLAQWPQRPPESLILASHSPTIHTVARDAKNN